MSEDPVKLSDQINNALTPFADFVSSIVFFSVHIGDVRIPLVVVWLITAAIVITVYLRFINIRGFGHAINILRGATHRKDHPGEISHFQALVSALSGTVGLGNIASVPIAIAIGGPGAPLWMIVAGFFGMSSKFAECALAVKYRRENPDGTVTGGPMFYIAHVFERRGLKTLGKGLALFFAVMTIGGSVSIFQVNQAHAQFSTATGISAPLIFGPIMAVLVGVVVIGGIKSIAQVTSRLVPFMVALYMGAGVIILIVNFTAIPEAFGVIVRSAFGAEAAAGGVIGAIVAGIQRATYSSEAGVGSAAIAHSAVRTNEPLTEGYVALLEPFADTVVVCVMTSLIVVVSGAYLLYEPNALEGIQITSAAFATVFDWFPAVLAISAILFAFSTLVTWVYYGTKGVAYIFNESVLADRTYKILICLVLATGASVSLSAIVDFIDSMLFAMAVPNIIAIYLLLPELRRDVLAYEAKRKAIESSGG